VNVLLRLLIGTGRLPDDVREVLAAEGVAVLEEGLSGSLTLRDYRAPGRRASWKKSAVSGAIAVTGRRLLVWVGGAANIDVPLDHPGRSAVGVEAETPDRSASPTTPRPSTTTAAARWRSGSERPGPPTSSTRSDPADRQALLRALVDLRALERPDLAFFTLSSRACMRSTTSCFVSVSGSVVISSPFSLASMRDRSSSVKVSW
jgi:hypothetical protein